MAQTKTISVASIRVWGAVGVVLALLVALTTTRSAPPTAAPLQTPTELVSTFSIVAFDPRNGDLGVAVQSKFFAVGRVVPFARAGVGAVATQSYANTTFGPRGLELLASGQTPQATIEALLANDGGRSQRQLGIVDATGQAAHFTGDACLPWAGARSDDNYTVQGNILAGPDVVDAMAEAFEMTSGDLAGRMLAAIAAGQGAGGDARGRQSAALLVVREGAGYGGYDDRFIDLRVDDHAAPIEELGRLLDIHRGQIAADRARARLAAASTAARPDEFLGAALAAAEQATRLNPADGWAWMTVAETYLALARPDDAAAAGRRALAADPWIKAAILQGIAGSTSVVEALLADKQFAEAWAAITIHSQGAARQPDQRSP